VQPAVPEAALGVVAAAVPDGRFGEPAAVGEAVAPVEAEAALAARPAAPDADAAAGAVAQPGVAAPRVFAASARPSERAWRALRRVLMAAVAAELLFSFALFAEPAAFVPGPAPRRQSSADLRAELPESLPASSGYLRIRDQTLAPPETSPPGSSSPICFPE
jgi:hypothetical protein